ncbi:MAG: DNA repair protein RadC [Clostridiales bacterium]|nr:DNA repair protein RadC [Clostridiales bacterium]
MNIKQMPSEEKPREKLLREGSDRLSTTEILAILINSGTKEISALEIAAQLLSMDKRGVRFLAECSPEELGRIKGMGQAKICTVLAAVELGKRIAAAPVRDRNLIRSSSDIADLFMEKMRYYKKEHFVSLMINAKGEIIEETEVSIGDLCSSSTHPREVFVDAVKRSAGSVVFLHNHPSGDPSPSDTDIQTTKRLIEAGTILGIPVLDHIIIGDGIYVSMKAMGLI